MHLFRLFCLFFILTTVTMAAPVTIRKRGFLGATRLIKGVVKYSGLGTFYEPGSGSCGEYNVDKDLVVAVNKAQMQNGANPNNNPHCGNMVSIEGTVGKTLARIEDTCPSCSEGKSFCSIPRVLIPYSLYFFLFH